MIPNKLILLLSFALVWSVSVQAQESVYRWQDADGTIHFSDEPPPDSVGGVHKMEVPKPEPTQSVTPSPTTSQTGDSLAKQRMAQRKALRQELDQLEQELEAARQAHQAGKAPKEGERQGIAGGRTKLSDAYFERLEREANEIKAMEKRISEIRAELLRLR